MQILSITSQKGGVGKTTLAMNLAVAAAADGLPCIVFDLDPQASATGYYDRRVANEFPDQPKVLSIQPVRLPQELQAALSDGYKLAIIDTPPNVSGNAVHISQAGDLILIPVRPSALDLDAVRVSIEIARASERPSAAILTQCKARSPQTDEARAVIETDLAFPVLSQIIGDRVAYTYAATTGEGVIESEPDSKAAEEITAVWKWAKSALKKIKSEETNTDMKEAANG